MIKYIFADDELLAFKASNKADPQKLGEALDAIAKANAGTLTPEKVVEAARDRRNPLHRHFDWNDASAAETWRRAQARIIIRAIRVEDDEMAEHPRAFLSVSAKAGVAYYSIQDVRSSAELSLIVLRQAERDLDAFQKRYRELTDVCDLVREAREKTATRRAAAEAAVQ